MRSKCLILLIALSTPTHAFLYIAAGTYNKGARPVAAALIWPTRSVTFVVNTNQAAYGGSLSASVTASEYLTAVQSAVSAWAGACNANLIVQTGGTTSSLDSGSDNVHVVTWDNRTTVEGNTFGASTSTLAAAFTTSNASHQLSDCDIVVNGNFSGTFGVNGESNRYDLVSTLAHEVGHCLGLDHPIEPPTYTSTNAYLTDTTMVQTAVAGIGSTYRRTVNQDDIDGIECVYERAKDFRNGTYCSSYHGTNGGAAISGVVSGGATADRSVGCKTGDSAAGNFIAKSTGSSGCVTEAFADADARTAVRTSQNGASWILYPLCLVLGFLCFKVMRKFLALFCLCGIFFVTQNTQASVLTLHGEQRWVKPELMNLYADLGPVIGGWTDYSTRKSYSRINSVNAAYGIALDGRNHFHGGAFLRVVPGAKNTHVAKNSSNGIVTTKTTELTSITLGPFLRLALGKDAFFPFFFAGGIGIGSRSVTQIISGAEVSTMKASAIGSEIYFETGAEFSIFSSVNLTLGGGFVRERSTVFQVSSTSGVAYSSVKQDDRLSVVSNGTAIELKSDFSGLYALAGLSVYF